MNRFLFFLLAVFLYLPSLSFAWSGTGTPASPYIIASCQDLQNVAPYCQDNNVHFELGGNIDCSGFGNFTPICGGSMDTNEFRGEFNGKYYLISDLTVNVASGPAGLFTIVGWGGRVRNLGIIDANIWTAAISNGSAGVLAGTCNGCDINNTYVYNGKVGTVSDYYAGGFVGEITTTSASYDANVTNCYVDSVEVYADATDRVGGFAGIIIGRSDSYSTCKNNYSTSTASSQTAEGNGKLGGFTGFVTNYIYDKGNYWDTEASGLATSFAGIGKTTVQMKQQSTFDVNGWDFINVWGIIETSSYPFLTEFPSNPLTVILDLNMVAIDGSSFFLPLPEFTEVNDAVLTIDFNVFEVQNRRLTIDLNYSSSQTQGTGTSIVNDLNLDSTYCTDVIFSGEPTTCSYDWNISGVSDGNYYIIAEISSSEASDFNASAASFRIFSDYNLFIPIPIDEDTGEQIDTNKYSFSVKIISGEEIFFYSGLTDANYYFIPVSSSIVSSSIVVTIDTNSSDYISRNYYIQFTEFNAKDTLQTYLVPSSAGSSVIIYTKKASDNTVKPDVLVRCFKGVVGFGRQEVQYVQTDSAGVGLMSFITGDSYDLDFYNTSGNYFFSGTIIAQPYPYYVYIDTLEIISDWEQPTIEYINIFGFPLNTSIPYSDSGYDLNILVATNGTIEIAWLTILNEDGNVFFDQNNTGSFIYHLDRSFLDSKRYIRVKVYVVNESGLVRSASVEFIPYDASGWNLVSELQSTDLRISMGCEADKNTPCFLLLIIAVFITIGMVASAATIATTDLNALTIVAMVSLSLFTFLTWIPVGYFVLACLGATVAFIASWRHF